MALIDPRYALRTYLLADNAINTVVGGSRIFPVILPQGETRPSVVYFRATGLGDYTSDGPSGLVRPRMQIDCWSLSSDIASSLANLVKERIDGFRGEMPYGSNSPPDVLTVRGVFMDVEREDYDAPSKLYRVSRDYFFWYAER